MKLTMKRSDVLALWKGLHAVDELTGASSQNVSFAYAIAKTKKLLKPEVEALRAAAKASPAYQKYDVSRLTLCKKHVAKNHKGKEKTIVDPETGDIKFVMKDQTAFDEALEELRSHHTDALTEREKQHKACDELLEKEVEIEIHQIFKGDVPAEISVDQMSGIVEMIKETAE